MLDASWPIEWKRRPWDEHRRVAPLGGLPEFRGHADQSWKLSTTLERAAIRCDAPMNMLWEQEKFIIHEFRSRAYHYVELPPNNEEYIEWLSIIQDYGGPTRLLDFTTSFYIASFFAMEFAEKDARIWAVNRAGLFARGINKKYIIPPDQNDWLDPSHQSTRWVEQYVKAKLNRLDFVLTVEPPRLNQRLAIQKGCFLFPFNIEKKFEQNLCAGVELPF